MVRRGAKEAQGGVKRLSRRGGFASPVVASLLAVGVLAVSFVFLQIQSKPVQDSLKSVQRGEVSTELANFARRKAAVQTGQSCGSEDWKVENSIAWRCHCNSPLDCLMEARPTDRSKAENRQALKVKFSLNIPMTPACGSVAGGDPSTDCIPLVLAASFQNGSFAGTQSWMLCSRGTPSGFSESGGVYSWQCTVTGVSPVSCSSALCTGGGGGGGGGCGDGTCGAGEDCDTCPDDCVPEDGDGVCNCGEECGAIESSDCGSPNLCLGCGNSLCEEDEGEDCNTCQEDCGACVECGNGVCDEADPCECPGDCPGAECGPTTTTTTTTTNEESSTTTTTTTNEESSTTTTTTTTTEESSTTTTTTTTEEPTTTTTTEELTTTTTTEELTTTTTTEELTTTTTTTTEEPPYCDPSIQTCP